MGITDPLTVLANSLGGTPQGLMKENDEPNQPVLIRENARSRRGKAPTAADQSHTPVWWSRLAC